MSTIIFLNGASSSGKTTITRELQEHLERPFLRIGIDTLLGMMPKKYMETGPLAHEGFHFVAMPDAQGPLTHVRNGPLAVELMRDLIAIAQLLADRGRDLIIDEVVFGDEQQGDRLFDYAHALKQHTVYFVGVFCSEQELIAREKSRRNRMLGLARDQMKRVHLGTRPYDVTVDTSTTSVTGCTQEILTFMHNNPLPTGFKSLEK